MPPLRARPERFYEIKGNRCLVTLSLLSPKVVEWVTTLAFSQSYLARWKGRQGPDIRETELEVAELWYFPKNPFNKIPPQEKSVYDKLGGLLKRFPHFGGRTPDGRLILKKNI